MTPENFERTMKALQGRVPFRPFTVALMNGDRFEVDFPNALIIRDGIGLFAGPGGVPWIFDHESVSQIFGDLMGEQPGGQNGTTGGGNGR